MMRRKLLAVSLPLLVCLGCVWLVTEALPGPRLLGPANPAPDLVVEKVTCLGVAEVTGSHPDAVAHYDMSVTVKNIGNANAPPCMVALCTTADVTASLSSFAVLHAQLPAVAPNTSKDALFPARVLAMSPEKRGMCIAAVDVSVQGKAAGQVNEWPGLTAARMWPGNTKAGEHNNAFGFAFDMSNMSKVQAPFSWTNPAVE